MAKQPAVPNLTGGSGVEVKKKVTTVYLTECPKCQTDLDVTTVTFGTHIECPECENVTYKPEYTPPWWVKAVDKGWKAILSVIITFLLGFGSSYFATAYFESNKVENPDTNTENALESPKDSNTTIKMKENGN